MVSGRNSNSFKLSCMSLLPARMRMTESKMKELECSQDFSHYKSMMIFPDAEGQLTPQSLVRSGRISNSSEMLWMFSLHASMNKIRSKMKALECSQHYTASFQTRKGRYFWSWWWYLAEILTFFKLSCMSSLPVRMRMIESNMKELECSQDFSHYNSMGIFPDAKRQLTLQSLVRSGRISNSSEMLWMSSLPASMQKI